MVMVRKIGLIVSFLLFAQSGFSAPKKYLMSAIGDSITVAFMADTYLQPPSLTKSSSVIETEANINELRQMIANQAKTDNKWTLSWATGKEINSQAILLNTYLKKKEPDSSLNVQNIAVTGAITADIPKQVDSLLAEFNAVNATGDKKYDALKYVTLLIGSNDACHGVSDSDLDNNLAQTFFKLSGVKQSEPVRILVSGIPKIPDLGFPEVGNSVGIGGFTCNTIRKVTNTCLSLATWNNAGEYATKVAYIASRNQIIKDAVNKASKKYGNLQIFYNDEIFQRKLTTADLAGECFHPNGRAQEILSTTMWNAQPWFH